MQRLEQNANGFISIQHGCENTHKQLYNTLNMLDRISNPLKVMYKGGTIEQDLLCQHYSYINIEKTLANLQITKCICHVPRLENEYYIKEMKSVFFV